MRKVAVVSILLVVLAGSAVAAWRFISSPETSKNSSETTNTAEQPAEPPVDTANLDTLIAQLIESHPQLEVSVSITDLERDKTYHHGVEAPYGAASIHKLVTASAILHQIEAGQLAPTASIGGAPVNSQLQQMIEVSDNVSWRSLYEYLGRDGIMAYADSIGLSSFDHETNTVTSNDIALWLTKLYRGQLLNAEHTQQLLGYMQRANYSQYIPAAVPDPLVSYHKVGFLEDRLHDAAIITDGKQSFVLVVFTKGPVPYDTATGADIMHQITRASIDTFLK